jgi:DNA-binding NtrC family response regulator
VEDRFISNQHLRVTRAGEGFHVRDLGSTNGTFLGGVRLIEAVLPLNTVLRVGDTDLIFEPTSQSPRQLAFHGILGTEPAVRELVEHLQRVAASPPRVTLLLGESGTGKELVAHALHKGSPRSDKLFIPINCAAISPALMESELFGHAKGAFTGATSKRKGAFEQAQGGTLFLDEVGELPFELQAKLLRVLENGEVKPVGTNLPLYVDVHVVAATHRELPVLVRQGKFREDLYYRLSLMPLVLPPLRGRRADIRLLAEHFLRALAPLEQTVVFTQAAISRLQQHLWPGNVRELRNVVGRALFLRQGMQIDAAHLSFEPQYHRAPEALAGSPLALPEGLTLEQTMQRLERQLIESTLLACNGNRNLAAERLGLARSSLFKRLKEWGLSQGEL